MLEQPALRIKPGPDPGGPAWLIQEPATDRPLGLARRRPNPGWKWRRWLTWPTLEVCESTDEALLFTLDHCWGIPASWLVRDADERDVGTLRGRSIWDRVDRFLAQVDHAGSWRTAAGQLLAIMQRQEPGVLLTFHGDDNPFLRMLVLAAVLRS